MLFIHSRAESSTVNITFQNLQLEVLKMRATVGFPPEGKASLAPYLSQNIEGEHYLSKTKNVVFSNFCRITSLNVDQCAVEVGWMDQCTDHWTRPLKTTSQP